MSWGVGRRTEVTVGNSHRCARSTATKLEAACRPTLTATMRTCWPGRVVARVRQPASHHGTRLEQVHAGPRGGHACPLWCHRLFSKRAVLEAPYVTVGGWCGSSIRDGGGGASDRRHAGRRHPANYRTSTPRVLASTGSLRVRLFVRVARAPQVDLADKPFRTLASIRPQLMTEELYINPGPIQFFGETADCRAKTLCLEESDYLDR